MKYTSTRFENQVTSAQAILQGLSLEGGLYVPTTIPPLHLDECKNKSYAELAEIILSLYFDDFSHEEIKEAVASSYNQENFTHPKMTGLRQYDDKAYFLELFYGKTSAFKDQALSLYPYLLKLAMKKEGIQHLSILTATSGDTGKAAMEAISDVKGLSIAVLFPKDGTSPIQKLQMQSQKGDNVYPLAIDGNFDDAQNAVKAFFMKHQDLAITSANSINIARLLPQIIYYYDLFVRLDTPEKVDVYVPTGNFGNILAAYIAKEMGLPIHRLIVCTNDNNVLYDFFTTGVYDIAKRDFKVTYSPSMDILISSNLERLLYFMFKDKTKVKKWMDDLKNNQRFELNSQELKLLQTHFAAQMCTNEKTYENIKDLFDTKGILIDPHTATALPQDANDHLKVVVSTASPYKFPALYKRLFELEDLSDFDILLALEANTNEPYPPYIKALEKSEVRFKQSVSLDEIEPALCAFIQKEEAKDEL